MNSGEWKLFKTMSPTVAPNKRETGMNLARHAQALVPKLRGPDERKQKEPSEQNRVTRPRGRGESVLRKKQGWRTYTVRLLDVARGVCTDMYIRRGNREPGDRPTRGRGQGESVGHEAASAQGLGQLCSV